MALIFPPFGAPADVGFPMRSLRFDGSSAYLSKTPGSAGDRKTWTLSVWVKRSALGASSVFSTSVGTSDTTWFDLVFNASNQLVVAGYSTYWRISNAVYRDISAWLHIVLAVDTTQATASDRIKLYVNGEQITSFGTETAITQNADTGVNAAAQHYIGRSSANYFNGYLSDAVFVDGQALTPSSFAKTNPTTGQWVPKSNPTAGLTMGTNGFWLSFDNAASTTTLGYDDAGGARGAGSGSNDWTLNNFSVTAGVDNDSLFDVPMNYADGVNGRGNFCTWNPLKSAANVTLSDGALVVTTADAPFGTAFGSIAVSTGKWYWEVTPLGGTEAAASMLGAASADDLATLAAPGYSTTSYGYFANTGNKYTNSADAGAYGNTYTVGDVIGFALDMDNGKIFCSKNGVWQASGDPVAGTNAMFTGLSGSMGPAVGDPSGAGNIVVAGNFGQRPFAYTPPTGHKALCTQSLSQGTITTSGTFTGNANADGPVVWLNGVPTTMTINSNAVTFGTHADKTAGGFKLRTSSASYNTAGSNTYSVSATGSKFKYARAQGNP